MAFDPWSAAITGGADLFSSALQNMQAQSLANQAQSFDVSQSQWQTMANQQQNLETQAFNAQQAAMGREFAQTQQQQAEAYNTQMSNTAFQRSRADAVAAGLNPMVLAGMGGASTPTMSAASAPTASAGAAAPAVGARGVVAPVRNLMQGMVSNAIQAGQASTLADKMEKEGDAASASSGLSTQLTEKASHDTRGAAANADTARANADVAEAEALNKVRLERARGDLYTASPGLLYESAKGALINEGAPKEIGGAVWRAIMQLGDWASRNKGGFTPTSSQPSNAKVLSQSANTYNQE